MVATKKRSSPVNRFITGVVDKPQVFFVADTKIAGQALSMAKHFYDTAKQHEPVEFSPFPELLTEGFETEQIWEEIASQNEPFLHYAKSAMKEYSRKRKRSAIEHESEDDEASVSGQSMELDHDDDFEEHEEEDASIHATDDDDNNEDEDEDEDNDNEDDDDELSVDQSDDIEEMDQEEEEEEEEPSSRKRSEVDDDFFDLEKFNKWTEEQEELDMTSDRDEDDDDIDFDNDLDQVDDEDDDDDALVDASEMTFKDFFVAPAKRRGTGKPQAKKVKFADEEPSEDDQDIMDEEENFDNEDEDEEQEPKTRNLFDDEEENNDDDAVSAHQKRLSHLQEQIDQFEQENIQDKHWTLKGETTAKARPVNSLLEEDLEFEQSVKPVPVITQETTNALEEIIKKRIVDNQFDDVERKADPQERPFLPSKRVEISDEQSKKSLAELYEQDYMKQKAGDTTHEKDEALKQEHETITGMFDQLCAKLDSLSNFHFTPRQPKTELTIVSDAAAISMEEATPVHVSDGTLLAPEEVYDKKKGEVKNKEEMSQEERKREHAKKKQQKRKERALKEREMKLIHKQNPGLGNKHAKMKAVKELLGQKNVEVIKNK